MENNTLAVLSVIMITFGFIQGCAMSKIVHETHVNKMENKLLEAIDQKFEADKRIDELENELKEERQTKQELINQLSCLVNKHLYLPPPERPLKRSRYYSEDSTDETFIVPNSPTCD